MGRLDSGILKEKVKNFVSDLVKFINKNYGPNTSPFLRHNYLQIYRSGSSVRVNLAEAEVAISDKEFRRILGICLREANETKERLKILQEDFSIDVSENMLNEIIEIIKILKAIIGKMS